MSSLGRKGTYQSEVVIFVSILWYDPVPGRIDAMYLFEALEITVCSGFEFLVFPFIRNVLDPFFLEQVDVQRPADDLEHGFTAPEGRLDKLSLLEGRLVDIVFTASSASPSHACDK